MSSKTEHSFWPACIFHGILESQNHFSWKSPPESSSPTMKPALPRPPLAQVPKCHMYTSPGMGTPPLPWAAVSGLNNPLDEDIFHNIQPKPPQCSLSHFLSSFPLVLLPHFMLLPTSGDKAARKWGYPKVFWMLLALHTLFPPGWTILTIRK